MATLENEANPFRRQALLQWLAADKQTESRSKSNAEASDSDTTGEETNPSSSSINTSFWEIPMSEVTLEKLASWLCLL